MLYYIIILGNKGFHSLLHFLYKRLEESRRFLFYKFKKIVYNYIIDLLIILRGKCMENEKEEIWKDIKGYEGRYLVSNRGRVKSLERIVIRKNGRKFSIKERILKPFTNHSGYLVVILSGGNGKNKTFLVHRLVCKAFHENPKSKPCVNHIDENKANNVVSNLEWCTYEENNNYGTRTARIAKTQSKPVGQYTLDGELVKIWQSTSDVQRQLGFSQAHISKVARGKRKTAYGYVWKYVEEGH